MSELKPLSGYCFVEPFKKYNETEGGIVIPQSVVQESQVACKIGKVVALTPYQENAKYKINQKWVKIWLQNPYFQRLLGKTVIYDRGQVFEHDGKILVRCKLTDVCATTEGYNVKVDTNIGLSKRCPFCKSKGDPNMLLDGEGFCIQCGKNEKGHRKSDAVKRVDPELSEFLNRR